MNRSSTYAADTRAASAALARLAVPDLEAFDRILLIDDSDEDNTQIVTMLTECKCPVCNLFQEVQS